MAIKSDKTVPSFDHGIPGYDMPANEASANLRLMAKDLRRAVNHSIRNILSLDEAKNEIDRIAGLSGEQKDKIESHCANEIQKMHRMFYK